MALNPKQTKWQMLILIAPFTTKVVFVASVDQDQAAQNVQPDLWSTLSTR